MELNAEAEIAAPPDRIWRILTEFDRYPEWNPFMSRVEGQLGVGNTLVVNAGSTEGKRWRFKPKVTIIDPGRELRWQGQLYSRGLFYGEQFFLLRALDAGRTRLVQGGNFAGLLLKYMGSFLTDTARGFVGMNQALKARAEKGF
jgi:hypothetical protein